MNSQNDATFARPRSMTCCGRSVHPSMMIGAPPWCRVAANHSLDGRPDRFVLQLRIGDEAGRLRRGEVLNVGNPVHEMETGM